MSHGVGLWEIFRLTQFLDHLAGGLVTVFAYLQQSYNFIQPLRLYSRSRLSIFVDHSHRHGKAGPPFSTNPARHPISPSSPVNVDPFSLVSVGDVNPLKMKVIGDHDPISIENKTLETIIFNTHTRLLNKYVYWILFNIEPNQRFWTHIYIYIYHIYILYVYTLI